MCGPRKIVAELDCRDALVFAKLLVPPSHQIFSGDGRAAPSNDEEQWCLTPFLIGNANGRCFGHLGMAHEDLLDVGCEDVDAARLDHVLDATGDIEITIVVEA